MKKNALSGAGRICEGTTSIKKGTGSVFEWFKGIYAILSLPSLREYFKVKMRVTRAPLKCRNESGLVLEFAELHSEASRVE